MKSENIPNHVVIIPDGNRRWAKEKGLAASLGHEKAFDRENFLSIFDEAKSIGIKYMSIWAFSTENWNRDSIEVSTLFKLFLKWLKSSEKDMHERKIKFVHIGRKDRLPKELIRELEILEEETKKYTAFTLIVCLDYGGRDEIIRAVNKMIDSGVKKVDEKIFSEYLDTKDIPDPDLIIRTSGEKRLSGMMPFQSVYAELYFTDCYFPDFDALELKKAVEEYGKRQRRFGGS